MKTENVSFKILFALIIYLFFVVQLFSQNSLPKYYDLRKLSLMSPVKDQGNCGACWAFASIGALESNCLKNGSGPIILSEDNIIDCHGFYEAPCYGGSFYMVNALFTRHHGPLLNSVDSYTPNNNDCMFGGIWYPPSLSMFVEEIRFLPKDINVVKNAIYKNGAIASSMFFNMANYSSSNYKYFDSYIDANDSLYPHCITIAGWNDTLSFINAPGKGGWIIKDSYGTNWADKGYFYVSYYDAGILSETVLFPTLTTVPKLPINSHVYYVDQFGWVDNYLTNSNKAYSMVEYCIMPKGGAILGQQIKRVGTYAVNPNMTITIEVFKSFVNGILSDKIASKTRDCNMKGFYTFDFNLPTDTIQTSIYLVASYQNNDGTLVSIPVELYEPYHTFTNILSQNQSYISTNGQNWNATGQNTNYNFDVCIKMYTEDAPIAKIAFGKSTVCAGESFLFEDRSPIPKDSICWLLNGEKKSNMAFFNHVFEQPGEHRIALVVYYGANNDTISQVLTVYPLPEKPSIIQHGDSLIASGAFSFLWYFNNNFVSNTNNWYYLPEVSGVYNVEISDVNDCKSMSDPFDFYLASADALQNIELNIFNGSSNDELIFELNNLDLIKGYSIYNTMGKKVYFESFNDPSNKAMVNIQYLPKGIYVVYLKGVERKYVSKIIKQGATY